MKSAAMKSLNLIARDNGAGLSRDLQLLADIFSNADYRVTVTGLGHRSRLGNRLRRARARLQRLWRGWFAGQVNAGYDINLMIEHVRADMFGQARRNVLLPNPEWLRAEWLGHLRDFDLVLAKTRHAERIFGELGCRTHYVGFTAADCRDASVAREATFFHGPGRSGNKGTLPLLELWARHPEWPLLTVVWRRKRVELPPLPANVRMIRDYLEDAQLRQLQNASLFHLCPSQTEGYGHSLVESLSVGGVTITTDAEPMNELVTTERGVLVSAHATGKQELATLYDFDLSAMEQAIERCIAMPEEERARLGANARTWFEDNARDFPNRLLGALQTLE
jgi:hypothetical protein